ncbi:hypothetical protein [Enterovirga sp. CN4-39]|uniref:hypothetical protein n=1 Tax=Enterovirga sp. CN4-39 TaxID=3400910 RepID=UPI003BFC6861
MGRSRTRAAGIVLTGLGAWAASPAAAFEGRYTAGGAGYEQSLVVTKTPTGFRGKIYVATRGCVGEFVGTGRPKGGTLVLRGRQDTFECQLTLRPTAAGVLDVAEDACLTFHGTACEFSGSYKRQAR